MMHSFVSWLIVTGFLVVAIAVPIFVEGARRRPPCPQQDCKGIFCAMYIKDSCTYDEYLIERCACCKHCPRQDGLDEPQNPCDRNRLRRCKGVACLMYIKESCTYEEYIAERCSCCKYCPIVN